MDEKEIVRDIMRIHGLTQAGLAERTGYSTSSGVSEALNRKRMSVDILVKLVSAMGCEVVVRSKDYEWVIGGEKTRKPKVNLNGLLEN